MEESFTVHLRIGDLLNIPIKTIYGLYFDQKHYIEIF